MLGEKTIKCPDTYSHVSLIKALVPGAVVAEYNHMIHMSWEGGGIPRFGGNNSKTSSHEGPFNFRFKQNASDVCVLEPKTRLKVDPLDSGCNFLKFEYSILTLRYSVAS